MRWFLFFSGVVLAVVAGSLFGNTFVPTQYIQTWYEGASKEGEVHKSTPFSGCVFHLTITFLFYDLYKVFITCSLTLWVSGWPRQRSFSSTRWGKGTDPGFHRATPSFPPSQAAPCGAPRSPPGSWPTPHSVNLSPSLSSPPALLSSPLSVAWFSSKKSPYACQAVLFAIYNYFAVSMQQLQNVG